MRGLSPITERFVSGGYCAPHGTPVCWRFHPERRLADAIEAYLFRDRIRPKPGQLGLLRDYLAYYAHAPYWDRLGYFHRPRVLNLRVLAPRIGSMDETRVWLKMAREIGWRPI